MQFVDSHCHIQSAGGVDGNGNGERSTRELWAKSTDITTAALVADAVKAGVSKMVVVGCDLADSRLALMTSAAHPECYASIGLHPHEAAAAIASNDLSAFAALAEDPKVMAIGECGLDFYYEHSPREQQIEVLKFQLDLAVKYNLPVIFHVRDAFDDFWPVFDSYNGALRGVLHSYTDSVQNLQKALDRKLYIGVNGIATFAKAGQQQMYQGIPLESILLETDSPFLTPVPFRGTINKPELIPSIAKHIADISGQPLDAVAQITTNNAGALFDM